MLAREKRAACITVRRVFPCVRRDFYAWCCEKAFTHHHVPLFLAFTHAGPRNNRHGILVWEENSHETDALRYDLQVGVHHYVIFNPFAMGMSVTGRIHCNQSLLAFFGVRLSSTLTCILCYHLPEVR